MRAPAVARKLAVRMARDAEFPPLDPSAAALGDEVYRVLGEAILDGRLRPGQRVRDVDLAERLGVSRTPIREALQRLERLGMIEVAANRYTRVSQPDAQSFDDTREFMAYVAGDALQLALPHCDDETLQLVLDTVDGILSVVDGGADPTAYLGATILFYQQAIRASGNLVFVRILRQAGIALQRNLQGGALDPPEDGQRGALVELRRAIARRDADAAERLILEVNRPRVAHPRYGGPMGHVELRDVDDGDLDAIFAMMRDAEARRLAAFTASDPDDRDAFDAWIARERARDDVSLQVVTENGGFAGTSAAFSVEGDREITVWLARHAWGRGVATAAVRLLLSREAVRPLFARVATHNAAAIAVLDKLGFTEVSRTAVFAPGLGRDVDEAVYTLMPALE